MTVNLNGQITVGKFPPGVSNPLYPFLLLAPRKTEYWPKYFMTLRGENEHRHFGNLIQMHFL